MQTSETFSAKRQIMQIITQWVPGSWAGNSKGPTPIRAETMSRHNEVMTPGKTKMLSRISAVHACGEECIMSWSNVFTETRYLLILMFCW